MLKLYYSKASSALAAHILLEEAGTPYTAHEVSIAKGDHQQPAFHAMNPKGRIPALLTPDGVLTENPAILEYIAARNPQANLVPRGTFQQAQARSLCAYLCATTHVAFAHLKRGARWSHDLGAQHAMMQKVPENLRDSAGYLEANTSLAPWALGEAYSFCDPYLFLLGSWMDQAGLTLDAYPRLLAHQNAMLARPATRAALAVHDLV